MCANVDTAVTSGSAAVAFDLKATSVQAAVYCVIEREHLCRTTLVASTTELDRP